MGEEQIEDRQSDLKDQQKKAALIKLKLDIDHGKLQKEQSKSSVLTAQVALLKKGLAAKNVENSELQSSIESLTKAVAAERKSAKKAQAQAKAFQLIGVGLNRTLGNVDEERTRALLISSDLLKVNHKLRDLLLSSMKENAESKRALAFFAGPKLQAPKEEQATEGETGNAAPDQSANE